MAVAGDIEAIRDWANSGFYTKEEVNDFFIKSQTSGLKAYQITINGVANSTVTITEENQQSPSYEFELDDNGFYEYLFFFTPYNSITIADNASHSTTWIMMNTYELTINLIS